MRELVASFLFGCRALAEKDMAVARPDDWRSASTYWCCCTSAVPVELLEYTGPSACQHKVLGLPSVLELCGPELVQLAPVACSMPQLAAVAVCLAQEIY